MHFIQQEYGWENGEDENAPNLAQRIIEVSCMGYGLHQHLLWGARGVEVSL